MVVIRFSPPTNPETDTVRLNLFPTLGPYLLPHVVAHIRQRFPRLELLLVEEKTEMLLEILREDRLNTTILALPLHEPWANNEFLFEEPFLLAMPDGHPLVEQTALRLEDLGSQNLLLLEEGHCLRDQALKICALTGAEEKESFRTTSLETLRQIMTAGVGMTLLPVLTVQPPVPPQANIHLLRFRDPPPNHRLAMIWRRSTTMAAFLRALAAMIHDLPPDLLRLPPAA